MMHIQTIPCNDFGELCYIVNFDNTCFLVDPGMADESEWLKAKSYLTSHCLTPSHVFITHCHADHCMGTGFVKRDYPDVKVCGSMEEQSHLPSVTLQARAFGLPYEAFLWAPITVDIHEGTQDKMLSDELGTEVHVIDCPGHSFHGLCYYLPEHKVLFSGDVLFYNSVGRSDFGPEMGGNGPLLAKGIVEKLFALPQQVKVCPGHGPYTTIGTEVQYNPYV